MSKLIKRKDGSYSPRGLWDNIRANAGSGKKPTKQMLAQEKKIKSKLEEGGSIPQRYRNMGFTHVGQKKEGDGQHKWKVLAKKGDKYKVVQGGYRGMKDFSQHHSEKRRSNFWNRMGGKNSAKANDKFSPLYWHKKLGKWEEGGTIPSYQEGGWFQTLLSNLNPFTWFEDKPEDYKTAFANARSKGLKTFTWNGKEYTTLLKGENAKPALPKKESYPEDEIPADWERFPNELLLWQAHKESGGFRPDVISGKTVSSANAKGLTQIRPIALEEYYRLSKNPVGSIDLDKPEDAVRVQKYLMNEHYNSDAATKGNPTDLVRKAKALAFYNNGRAATVDSLNAAKEKGHDIYKSLSWLDELPLETSDYVKKILLHKVPSHNVNFHKDTTNSPYNKYYNFGKGGMLWFNQKGGNLPIGQAGIKTNPKYPYWNTLTDEEKKLAQSTSPIGRGIRMKAATGKVGQTAKEITSLVKDAEDVGAELTGLPGSTRFIQDPIGNLKGAGKTIEQTILGSSPYVPQQINTQYNPEDTQKFFNTLDIAGLASSALPLAKPALSSLRQAGKYATTQTALKDTWKINPLANKTVPLNKLYHKSNNPNLKLEDIDLVRTGESQLKKKHLALSDLDKPSGFYTSDEPFYSFMGGRSKFSFDFPANSKIKDLANEGRITDRLSKKELLNLKQEGYDIIKGRNMLGKTEYIPLNKEMMSNWKFEGTAGLKKDIPGAADYSMFSHLEPVRDVRFQTVKPHWLRGYQSGGVITDQRGQWAHPGKVTKIMGNDITMKGVPYPVFAETDKGQQVIMQPEQNYHFTGAKSVTEYPMATTHDYKISKYLLPQHKTGGTMDKLGNVPYDPADAHKKPLNNGLWALPFKKGGQLYGKSGIHIKPENKGKFTAWAKSHGMGVQQAASHVMANKGKYSSTIVKRANFAKNAAKWKHAFGGSIDALKMALGGKMETGGAFRPNRSSASGVMNFYENSSPKARMFEGGDFPNSTFGDKTIEAKSYKMGGHIELKRPDSWVQASNAVEDLNKNPQQSWYGESNRSKATAPVFQGGIKKPLMEKGGKLGFRSKTKFSK